ncbi:hypothetical protein J5Y04_00565 [Kitasatospora sp. RG8]|uniref:SitI3 family protein n=1 Tax=Kitasatospora sp. RG8 TaxID=2820815 RepID=UPI001AE0650B|nr:SitI3 family protein [Kitasatospora sp. RG8]MBP0448042.1 hypothetical protein [Kitasatospora sp. RG8]
MALDFDLELTAPVTAGQLAAAVWAAAGPLLPAGRFTPGDLLTDGVLTVRETWLKVVESQPVAYWQPTLDCVPFTATARLALRLGKFTDLSAQQDDMTGLAAAVLALVPAEADAALHFQSEVVWLVRRGGLLSLSERSDLWPPHRLAAFPGPYARAAHTLDGV